MSSESHPLAEQKILLTRPAGQADRLCLRIEAAGGTAYRAPLITISAAQDPAKIQTILDSLASQDVAIFISVNAVDYGLAQLQARGQHLSDLELYAVGRATHTRLIDAGYQHAVYPSTNMSSEGLLALPALAATRIAGRQVLIFRGNGGCEKLREVLAARGARVTYAEVYARERVALDLGALTQLELSAIVVTSGEAMEHLTALAKEQSVTWPFTTALIVVGERQVTIARKLGFTAITGVRDPGDEAMIAALASLTK